MRMSNPFESPLIKGPVAWMASNPVAANLFMLILLVGGFAVGSNIKQEVFPAYDREQVQVNIAYPGASPEEVERGLILAVEEAIQNLDGVDEIRSTAAEGRAVITVDALEGADPVGEFLAVAPEFARVLGAGDAEGHHRRGAMQLPDHRVLHQVREGRDLLDY